MHLAHWKCLTFDNCFHVILENTALWLNMFIIFDFITNTSEFLCDMWFIPLLDIFDTSILSWACAAIFRVVDRRGSPFVRIVWPSDELQISDRSDLILDDLLWPSIKTVPPHRWSWTGLEFRDDWFNYLDALQLDRYEGMRSPIHTGFRETSASNFALFLCFQLVVEDRFLSSSSLEQKDQEVQRQPMICQMFGFLDGLLLRIGFALGFIFFVLPKPYHLEINQAWLYLDVLEGFCLFLSEHCSRWK